MKNFNLSYPQRHILQLKRFRSPFSIIFFRRSFAAFLPLPPSCPSSFLRARSLPRAKPRGVLLSLPSSPCSRWKLPCEMLLPEPALSERNYPRLGDSSFLRESKGVRSLPRACRGVSSFKGPRKCRLPAHWPLFLLAPSPRRHHWSLLPEHWPPVLLAPNLRRHNWRLIPLAPTLMPRRQHLLPLAPRLFPHS